MASSSSTSSKSPRGVRFAADKDITLDDIAQAAGTLPATTTTTTSTAPAPITAATFAGAAPPHPRETMLPPDLAVQATERAGLKVDAQTVRNCAAINNAAGVVLPRGGPTIPAPILKTAPAPSAGPAPPSAKDPKLSPNEDPKKRSICIRRLERYVAEYPHLRSVVPQDFAKLPLVRLEELCDVCDEMLGYGYEKDAMVAAATTSLSIYEQFIMPRMKAPFCYAHGVSAVAEAQVHDRDTPLGAAVNRLSIKFLGRMSPGPWGQFATALAGLVYTVSRENLSNPNYVQAMQAMQAAQKSAAQEVDLEAEEAALAGVL